MSSEEFSLHQAYWAVEPSGPHGEVQRWAALMAAVTNGPRVKRSKQPFKAAEFWPADVWDPPAEPEPASKGKARLAPDFSHLRGMTVRQRKR
jgi:hypothetical protein